MTLKKKRVLDAGRRGVPDKNRKWVALETPKLTTSPSERSPGRLVFESNVTKCVGGRAGNGAVDTKNEPVGKDSPIGTHVASEALRTTFTPKTPSRVSENSGKRSGGHQRSEKPTRSPGLYGWSSHGFGECSISLKT